MAFVRKWVFIVLLGAVVGDAITMLIAPAVIGWYNSTVDPSAMCNCLSTARTGAAHMIQAQGVGSASIALLFLVVGALISHNRRRRLRAQTPPAPAATPPSTS